MHERGNSAVKGSFITCSAIAVTIYITYISIRYNREGIKSMTPSNKAVFTLTFLTTFISTYLLYRFNYCSKLRSWALFQFDNLVEDIYSNTFINLVSEYSLKFSKYVYYLRGSLYGSKLFPAQQKLVINQKVERTWTHK